MNSIGLKRLEQLVFIWYIEHVHYDLYHTAIFCIGYFLKAASRSLRILILTSHVFINNCTVSNVGTDLPDICRKVFSYPPGLQNKYNIIVKEILKTPNR